MQQDCCLSTFSKWTCSILRKVLLSSVSKSSGLMTSATVVIPCKNRHESVKKAILSAVGSKHINEIIVVDDGSNPPLSEKLADWPGLPVFAKIVPNTKERGAVGARKFGAECAGNDLIVFLDSDDAIERDGVDRLIGIMNERPAAAMAYANVVTGASRSNFQEIQGRAFLKVLRNLCLCPFSGLVARRSVINWDNLDERLPAWQDDDFCLEASKSGEIYFVDTVAARMFSSNDSISNSKERQCRGLALLLVKWKPYILKHFGWPRYFLWQIRWFVLRLETLSQRLDARWARMGRRVWGIPLKRLCQLLRYLLSPFFDRMYA